jgi:hypothetical protein
MDAGKVPLGMVMWINRDQRSEVCGTACPRCQAPAKWVVDHLRTEYRPPGDRFIDLRMDNGCGTIKVSTVTCVNGHLLPEIPTMLYSRFEDRNGHRTVVEFPSFC